MTDIVWVAVISAGAALVTALVTQYLATLAANKQADRSERREATQWERTEALRREEIQRKEAQEALAWERSEALRKQELHDARLRELWGFALEANWRIWDLFDIVQAKDLPEKVASGSVSAARMPIHAAGQAYGVALLWLTALRPEAKAFYLATLKFQKAIYAADGEQMMASMDAWNKAFRMLEVAITALADGQLKRQT